MKQKLLNLSDDLFLKIEDEAKANGVTQTKFITELLENYFKKSQKEIILEALNEFFGKSSQSINREDFDDGL